MWPGNDGFYKKKVHPNSKILKYGIIHYLSLSGQVVWLDTLSPQRLDTLTSEGLGKGPRGSKHLAKAGCLGPYSLASILP